MNKETIHISGIDIPKDLFDAAAENKLVIFVGAGISKPSGIPNFNNLTKEILKGGPKSYDESLSNSEKLERAELDGVNIRREAQRIIRAQNTGPSAAHKSIINFFGKEKLRIVTTNYDQYLTKVAEESGIPHKSYYQPALPHGDSFDGIVYLHGAIFDQDDERGDVPLIITDKDFASFYLKYGRQASFIKELFGKYTVLFIGYSYDDKIFQYLAKSDSSKLPKYIFVSNEDHEKDPQKWETLNLIARPYNKDNEHKQLWSVMNTWGSFINREPSEHQQEIERIVRCPEEITSQDNDYIKYCIENIGLAKHFFKHAKSEQWLKWAKNNDIIDFFFKENIEISETEKEIIFWFVNNFVLKNSELALDIVQGRNFIPLNPHLVGSIALSFRRASEMPNERNLSKWIHIILAFDMYIEKADLALIIEKCKIPHDNDIVLLLFNKLTFPERIEKQDYSESAAYWVNEVWKKKFEPKISSLAYELEPIIIHYIKLYELKEKTKYGISRHAIRYSLNGSLHYVYEILIKIAASIMDCYNELHPDIAIETIERWYQQRTSMLKQLSIYGIIKNSQLTDSEKFSWLLDKKELLNPSLRSKNFELVQDIYSNLTKEEKHLLYEYIAEESDADYEIYDLFVRINRADPSCKLAEKKLKSLQNKNPEFKPSESSELVLNGMTWSGAISPISKEELVNLTTADSVHMLATYKGEGGFGKPTRDGLMVELRKAIEEDYQWSYTLAVALEEKGVWCKDIWHSFLDSWGRIENINEEVANSMVMFILKNTDLHTLHHYPISQFLSKQGEIIYRSQSNEKNSFDLAIAIRDIAFAENSERSKSVIIDDKVPDWWGETINSTGHYVCIFFINLFSDKYKNRDQANQKLEEFFMPIIENTSLHAQMGKNTLSYCLSFFFTANEQWSKEFILPLFDWTVSYECALQSWQAFLHNGSWISNLYDDLIRLHEKTFDYFKGLGEVREKYSKHIAGLALYGIIDDKINLVETGFIHTFIYHCEKEDIAAFSRGIYLFLKDNEEVQKNNKKIWQELLLPYLNERISGKPKLLCKEEFDEILKWCAHLRSSNINEYVEKIIEADEHGNIIEKATEGTHTYILRGLNDSTILQSKPEIIGKYLLYLVSRSYFSRWDWEELEETIQKIRQHGCSSDTISEIIEECLNQGYNGATVLNNQFDNEKDK